MSQQHAFPKDKCSRESRFWWNWSLIYLINKIDRAPGAGDPGRPFQCVCHARPGHVLSESHSGRPSIAIRLALLPASESDRHAGRHGDRAAGCPGRHFESLAACHLVRLRPLSGPGLHAGGPGLGLRLGLRPAACGLPSQSQCGSS